jgi:hypothetical protein
MRLTGSIPSLFVVATSFLVAACDVPRYAADSSARLAERAAPGFESFWDYELVGEAMPANIVQLESLLRVSPENARIVLQLQRTYVGYAFGWVEDRAEALEEAEDFRAAEEQRRRAKYMYLRARDLGFYAISLEHDGFDAAAHGNLEAFRAYLQANFEDRGDARVLFWTGSAWGSFIGQSRDDMSAAGDLPFARALVERSVELDPDFQFGSGRAFLAAVESSAGDGDLARSKALFEEAIAQTERHNLMILVQMANTYAVAATDRPLYESLLREVRDAGDVLPEARLSNRIAKRRAERYLRLVGQRFP